MLKNKRKPLLKVQVTPTIEKYTVARTVKSGRGRQYGSVRESCFLEVKWEWGIWHSEIHHDNRRCTLGVGNHFIFFSFTSIVTIKSKVSYYIAKCVSRSVSVLFAFLWMPAIAQEEKERDGERGGVLITKENVITADGALANHAHSRW